VIEQAGVGREVRARRAADRLLIDAHQPLDRSMPPAIRPPTSSTARARDLASSSSRDSWPSARATSSTSAWLTRLDLPEPDTPVTVVNTPSGNATSSSCRLLRVTPAAAASRAARAACARGGAVANR
jgi:hypothetical protein